MRPKIRYFTDTSVKNLSISLCALLLFFACKDNAAGTTSKVLEPKTEAGTPNKKNATQAADKTSPQVIGDIVLLSPKADAFGELTKDERRLANLYSLIANEVEMQAFRLNGTANETVRHVLLGILAAGNQVPSPIRNKIRHYTDYFLLNRSTRNTLSRSPFQPQFIPGELAAAAQIALNKGIDLGTKTVSGDNLGANQIEQLELLLKNIRPWLYNADRHDAGIPEERGEGQSPSLKALKRTIAKYLQSALPLMDKAARAATDKLLLYLRSGDASLFAAYKAAFAQTVSPVEFFIEIGKSSRSSHAQGNGIRTVVAARDPQLSKKLNALAQAAPILEKRLPMDARFKRKEREIHRQTVGAYDILSASGMGYLLPTIDFRVTVEPPESADSHTKYMFFSNLFEARSTSMSSARSRAHSFDEATAVRSIKCGPDSRITHIALREIIGRNAGKMSHTRKGAPEKYLRETAALIDEARAESVALFLALDPSIIELDFFQDEECARALYDEFLFSALESSILSKSEEGNRNNIQASQMLLNMFLESGAAEIAEKDGRYCVRVLDYDAMQNAVGTFLGRLQRIKSTGNYLQAKELLNQYAADTNPVWRQSLLERKKVLSLPGRLGYLFPILVPQTDAAGRILDVGIEYPRDIINHALRAREVARQAQSYVIDQAAPR